MQRAERLQTIKRKKRELARLEKELVKLRQEEQVVKVPVARLFQLLNTPTGNESVEEEEASTHSYGETCLAVWNSLWQ